MIVFHAGIFDGRFWLWAEASSEAEQSKKRGRKPKGATRFPYDAGQEGLKAALEEAGVQIKVLKSNVEQNVVWLPSVRGWPLPSSTLIAVAPEIRIKPALAPWTTTGIRLTTEQAVNFLCVCKDKQMLAPGIVIGQDVRFWTAALRFAGALTARQHYLPGVAQKNGDYCACWTPVFSGEDSRRLKKLAGGMPQICRAMNADSNAPPKPPPAALMAAFVEALVDHLVRTSFVEEPVARRKKKAPAFDSLHDQWLYALQSPDGAMSGDAEELARFAEDVRAWQQPVMAATTTPFRLCFRLEEPDRQDGMWHVRFFLQSADDPSLLIPTKDAWKSRGRQALLLKKGEFNATEYLLWSLGQAAGLCPNIEGSLKTARPEGYEFDVSGAFEFLTKKSAALEQAGFGVLLPAWWTRRGRQRLAVRAQAKAPRLAAGNGLTMDAIVEVNWALALGEKEISLDELEALAKLKAPLVQVRGQWVHVSAEEIQAAVDFWKKKGDTATVREVMNLALGVDRAAGELDFEGVEAEGTIGEWLARLQGQAAFEEMHPPQGLHGTLRPYQVRGYSWLGFLRRWGLGACLADDMGLGKTVQTLALIQRDREQNGKQPVLLICPTSVVNNWQKEAARFTPDLSVMIHHGIGRQKGDAFRKAAEQHAMVISSYALLSRDIDTMKTVSWLGVVLDEAQNIKNSETKQARAARALQANYRLALTGTPVENNVGDLWSIMEFLNPGLLGTQAEFKRAFFIPIQAYRDADAMAKLNRRTRPFVLRRLKTDKTIISDLPDKMEMKVFCPLTKEQASLYAAVVDETLSDIDSAEGIERRGKILSTLMRLKQVCNHPAQFLNDNSTIPGRSGKVNRLTEMLEEMAAVGDRALVFSQFAEMGAMLQRHLQDLFGREVFFLHGGTSRKRRDEMVTRFQEDERAPSVFILSLKAGGTGLNLTRANHVFHFDRWWNPAVENQATDRAFRIGQTRNVQVHKFLCAGTLEERIDEMIERKKEVAEMAVGAGEGWLTELSTDELKTLFTLDDDAIGE